MFSCPRGFARQTLQMESLEGTSGNEVWAHGGDESLAVLIFHTVGTLSRFLLFSYLSADAPTSCLLLLLFFLFFIQSWLIRTAYRFQRENSEPLKEMR